LTLTGVSKTDALSRTSGMDGSAPHVRLYGEDVAAAVTAVEDRDDDDDEGAGPLALCRPPPVASLHRILDSAMVGAPTAPV